jgi:hypothetical protein
MSGYYNPPSGGGGGPESDPVFTAWDKSTGISITESQVSDLGSYIETESDPVFAASLTPYNSGNVSGLTAFNYSNGKLQKAALTGAMTIDEPTNPVEGARLELWLTASGANRSLDVDPAIVLPSESAVSFPKTLTSGQTYALMLRYNGSAWWLVSLVGGY